MMLISGISSFWRLPKVRGISRNTDLYYCLGHFTLFWVRTMASYLNVLILIVPILQWTTNRPSPQRVEVITQWSKQSNVKAQIRYWNLLIQYSLYHFKGETPSIRILNRIGDKRQPWQGRTMRNKLWLWLYRDKKACNSSNCIPPPECEVQLKYCSVHYWYTFSQGVRRVWPTWQYPLNKKGYHHNSLPFQGHCPWIPHDVV